MSKLKAALATAVLGAAYPAVNAATVVDSMSLDQLLNAPADSYSGAFAITNLLDSNGLHGGTVNSATVTAFGFSDAAITQSSSYGEQVTSSNSYSVVVGGYTSCGWWGGCSWYPNYGTRVDRSIQATTNIQNTDAVQDTMSLTVGGLASSGQVGHQASQTSSSVGYSRSNYVGSAAGTDTVISTTTTTTDTFSGALQAQVTLGAADILALAQSGALSFNVGAQVGQFHLQSVQLSMDVTAAAANPVPEPESAALTMAGLAVVAAAARARRNRRSQDKS